MRTFKLGKTEFEVRRQTGFDELHTSVANRKLVSKIAMDEDPFVRGALVNEAWILARVIGSVVMRGTVARWSVPRYTDSPDVLWDSLQAWLGLDGRLRDVIFAQVAAENEPLNDPKLVPPELLRPEEREDPLSEPPEGGSEAKSATS